MKTFQLFFLGLKKQKLSLLMKMSPNWKLVSFASLFRTTHILFSHTFHIWDCGILNLTFHSSDYVLWWYCWTNPDTNFHANFYANMARNWRVLWKQAWVWWSWRCHGFVSSQSECWWQCKIRMHGWLCLCEVSFNISSKFFKEGK